MELGNKICTVLLRRLPLIWLVHTGRYHRFSNKNIIPTHQGIAYLSNGTRANFDAGELRAIVITCFSVASDLRHISL